MISGIGRNDRMSAINLVSVTRGIGSVSGFAMLFSKSITPVMPLLMSSIISFVLSRDVPRTPVMRSFVASCSMESSLL